MKALLPALILLLSVSFVHAQRNSPLPAGVPDRPGAFLYDPTNLLSSDEQVELNNRLIAFRDSTSNELAVLILRRIPEGEAMEDFVNQVFNRWGIGNKEKNNGVLLAVFVNDRKMRIEVGYGLEPVLTDGITGRIQRETLRPAFRDGEYAKGINAAISELEAASRGEFSEPARPQAPWWEWVFTLGFAVAIYGLLGYVALVLLRMIFLGARRVIREWMGKPHDRWGEPEHDTWYGPGYTPKGGGSGGSSSDSGWSSSSGSSSSSDFGGGSSGGGGSSSDW